MTTNKRPAMSDAQPARQPTSIYLAVLLLTGLASTAIYTAALQRFPLLSIYATPLQNLDKLTGSSGAVGLTLAACVLLLFAGYGMGALAVTRLHGRPALPLVVIGLPLIFVALLLLVYPTSSIDLYDYLFRGRMAVRYQANTFVRIPTDYERDPLFQYIAWRRAVTAYGPVWEAMSRALARLAGEVPGVAPGDVRSELLRLMLAYKILSVSGFLLCGAAIWAALGRIDPDLRWFGLYLWLWNPLALWESVAAGHNDSWMALLIVLAVGALAPRAVGTPGRGRSPVLLACLALLAITFGGLIKYLAFIIGPTLLLAALRQLPTWGARVRLTLVDGLACLALVVLCYAPFWEGTATLRNFSDRGTLFTATWLATFQAALGTTIIKEAAQGIAASLSLGLLVFGIFWSAVRAWFRPAEVAAHVLWLLLWFLFVCSPWFQPWYLLWALALVALQPRRTRMLRVVTLFCCTALLSYIAGSFLLPALGWSAESAAWNGLVSLLIYGLPLLALGWGKRAYTTAVLRRAARLPRALVTRRGRGAVVR